MRTSTEISRADNVFPSRRDMIFLRIVSFLSNGTDGSFGLLFMYYWDEALCIALTK